MTEFHITCTSCATRLKVNKPSLVGKILACPKCGTMLSIVVPKEHRPPSDTSTASPESSTIPLKRELTTNDFNEIELLLQKNEIPPGSLPADPKQRFYGAGLPGMQENTGDSRSDRSLLDQPARKKAAGSSSNASPSSDTELKQKAQTTGSAGTKGKPLLNAAVASQTVADQNGPLLPSDRWTSPEIRRRRKMMGFLAAGLGLIFVLLLTAIGLVNGFGNSEPEQVAANNDPPQEIVSGEKENEPKLTNNLKEDAKEDGEVAAAAPVDSSANNLTEAEKSDAMELPESAHADLTELKSPTPVADSELPPMIPGQSELPNTTTPNSPPATTNQQPTDSVSDGANPNGSAPPPIPLPSTFSEKKTSDKQADQRLERLAQLLDGPPVSVARLKDLAASEKEENNVGVSKYLIKKSDKPLDPVDNLLKVPCESLKYEKVRLSLILQDLMRVTAIPITLDLPSIRASQGTSDPVIDLEMAQGNFASVFESLAESAGIARKTTDTQGLVFYSVDRDELIEAKYDPPKFKLENGEDSRKLTEEFILYIQSMIEADSWKRQEDPPSILLIENQIKVRHNRMVQAQIVGLIARMNGVIGLGEKLDDTDFQNAIKTKASLSADMFAKPSKVGHRLEEPLLEVLSRLSEGTGINIVTDWDRLEPLGWRPSTLIPGNLYASTLGGFVSELTQALEITYVVIDEKTLLLTSFEGAAAQTDLEVFHFGLLLKGKVKDEFALSVISSLLRDEFNHPLVRIYFEKRVRSLVVIAPQSVQRKIERMLKAIIDM